MKECFQIQTLGGIVFENKTVTINASIENDLGRYSFTLAHEIGHRKPIDNSISSISRMERQKSSVMR